MRSAFPLLALLALAGCGGGEEESAAEKMERLEAEIRNRAQRLEAEAANAVGAEEARLEAEAAAMRNRADTANEADGDSAAPAETPGETR